VMVAHSCNATSMLPATNGTPERPLEKRLSAGKTKGVMIKLASGHDTGVHMGWGPERRRHLVLARETTRRRSGHAGAVRLQLPTGRTYARTNARSPTLPANIRSFGGRPQNHHLGARPNRRRAQPGRKLSGDRHTCRGRMRSARSDRALDRPREVELSICPPNGG
jgi:hypothetical protein